MPPGSEVKASPTASGPSVGSLLQALAKERSKGLVLDLRTGAIKQKSTPIKARPADDDAAPTEVAPAKTSPASKTTARATLNQQTRPPQPAGGIAGDGAKQADDVSESSESPSAEEAEGEEADEISEEPPRSSIPRSDSPSSQSIDPEAHFEPPAEPAREAFEKEASTRQVRLRPQRTVTLVPSKAILQEGRIAGSAAASNALDPRSSAKDRRRKSGVGMDSEVRLLSRKDSERAAIRHSGLRKRASPARWRPTYPGDEDGSDSSDSMDDMDSDTAPASRPGGGDSSASTEGDPRKPLMRTQASKQQQADPLAEFYRGRPGAQALAASEGEELAMPVARDMQKAEDREAVKAKKRVTGSGDAPGEGSITEKVRFAAESTDVLPKEAKKRLREEKVRDRAAAAAAAAAASSAAVSSTPATSALEMRPAATLGPTEPDVADTTLEGSQREHKKKKKKRRKHSAIDEEGTPQLADQQAETPAGADLSRQKEKKSKKSKRKHDEEATAPSSKAQPQSATAQCDNFWGPPSASYAPPPTATAASTAGAQPAATASQTVSPFDVAAGKPPSGTASVPQQGASAVHKKKRKRHKSKSSSDSSGSSSSGSEDSSADKTRKKKRRRSRSRGGRRRRRKHSKGPPDAWAVWPPPPGAGFTPQPWGWQSAFGWPPGAPPQQPGSAWSQASPGAPPAGMPPAGPPPAGTVQASTAPAAEVAAGAAPAAASPTKTAAPELAAAEPVVTEQAATEPTKVEAAAPAGFEAVAPDATIAVSTESSIGNPAAKMPAVAQESTTTSLNSGSAAAVPETLQKLSGEDRTGEQAVNAGSAARQLEGIAEVLMSDPYGGAQEDPYGGAEEDPYGGAAEDPYGAAEDAAVESAAGSADQLGAVGESQLINSSAASCDPAITDPLVRSWRGAAKTLWQAPPALELDPELARPTPPHKQRARRKRRKSSAKQKAASEATDPAEPAIADSSADVDSAHTEVLQMPLWSRISEWSDLSSLELDESLRRLPEKVKSAEYGRRMALRSALRATPLEMEAEVPSNPAEPHEADNLKESFLLSVAHTPRQGVRMVDWYAPPRLELPKDVIRDSTAYVGTEKARRQSARQDSGNGRAAPPVHLFNQVNPTQTTPVSAQLALPAPAPTAGLPAAVPAPAPAAALPTAMKASAPAPALIDPSLIKQLAAQAMGLPQMQALPAATLPALPPPPPPTAAALSILGAGTTSKAAPLRPPMTSAPGFTPPGWTTPVAVPPLSGDPLAAPSTAGSSHPQAAMSYTDKLLAFMTKLETTNTPTDAAVREFWLQLSVEDRTRFSTEFPQFMHHVTGQRTTQSPQAAEPKTLRVDGLLPAVSADELAGRFGQYGQVLNVSIRKRHGAAQRHVGFVQFARSQDADEACQALDNALFAGTEVRVTERVVGAEASQLPAQAAPLDTAELKRRKQDVWSKKITFHQAVLRVDMRSMQLTDDDVTEWCNWVPALLRPLVQHSKDPVTNADMNFSENMITDAGVSLLTKLLQEHNLHCCRISFDGNRLTDQALCTLGDYIGQFSQPLHELRLERNNVKASYGIVQLARCVKLHQGYPVWRSDVSRYTPFMLCLAHNFIEHAASVTQSIKDACGSLPCLSEKQGFWEAQHLCPSIQLPSFTEQQAGPAGAQHWGTSDQQLSLRPRNVGRPPASLPHN